MPCLASYKTLLDGRATPKKVIGGQSIWTRHIIRRLFIWHCLQTAGMTSMPPGGCEIAQDDRRKLDDGYSLPIRFIRGRCGQAIGAGAPGRLSRRMDAPYCRGENSERCRVQELPGFPHRRLVS